MQEKKWAGRFVGVFMGCLFPLVQAQTDTMVRLQMAEVEAFSGDLLPAGVRAIRLDSLHLHSLSAQSLGAWLELETGAHMRSYGPGLLGSFSYRGTGPSRTSLQWNGLQVNFPTVAQGDLNLWNSQHVDRLLLVPGGAAAQFGQGSAGAVLLSSNSPMEELGFAARLQASTGSFGFRAFETKAQWKGRHGWAYLGWQHRAAENNFSYQDFSIPGFPEVEMQHAAYSQQHLQAGGGFKIKRVEMEFHGWISSAHREIPAAMGAAQTFAKQEDLSIRLSGKGSWKQNAKGWKLEWVAGMVYDAIDYQDLYINSPGTMRQWQGRLVQRIPILHNLWLHTGAETMVANALVSGYTETQSQWWISPFVWLDWMPGKRWRISYQMRKPFASGQDAPLTGTLGFEKGWHFRRHWFILMGNFRNHYRVPGLNDLFWQPGGNLELLPEFGWQSEGGLHWEGQLNPKQRLGTKVTLYFGEIDEFIQWIPQPQGFWAAENLDAAQMWGIESSVFWEKSLGKSHLHAKLGCHLNRISSAAEPGKQLVYVPQWLPSFSLKFQRAHWEAFASVQYTSDRFTDAANVQTLPAYFLAQARVSGHVSIRKWRLSPFVELWNATNSRFQTLRNRPQPGLSLFGGLQLSFFSKPHKQLNQ